MRIIIAAGILAAVCSLPVVAASAQQEADQRTDLNLTPAEKTEFLSGMRQMLASIQGIISGIGASDRLQIAESAKISGNKMARATPDSVREKLPQSFKAIGGPTHMKFEELAIRAETDDMDMLAAFTAEIMEQCLACHVLFKTD